MNENSNVAASPALRFLTELRARLINSLIVMFVLFAALMFFANHLYDWLALPLLKFLPAGHLIATQVVSPFFVPFRLAFMAAMLLATPYFLFQLWGFIAPALYGHEKRLVWPFLWVSALLFYVGVAFGYFVILPTLFQLLANVGPKSVLLSPDISEYLGFTSNLLLIFGALFEIPMVMVLLTSTQIVPLQSLNKRRGYVVLIGFVIGMFIMPDVLSQTLLAITVWLLYEVGLLMSRVLIGAKARAKEVQP